MATTSRRASLSSDSSLTSPTARRPIPADVRHHEEGEDPSEARPRAHRVRELHLPRGHGGERLLPHQQVLRGSPGQTLLRRTSSSTRPSASASPAPSRRSASRTMSGALTCRCFPALPPTSACTPLLNPRDASWVSTSPTAVTSPTVSTPPRRRSPPPPSSSSPPPLPSRRVHWHHRLRRP